MVRYKGLKLSCNDEIFGELDRASILFNDKRKKQGKELNVVLDSQKSFMANMVCRRLKPEVRVKGLRQEHFFGRRLRKD